MIKYPVLIIDSDQALTERLSAALTQEEFSVTCAHDGVAGLKIALTKVPDLIILDLLLPDLNGLDVLTRFRQHHATPVMVLCSREDDVDRILAFDSGANDYLVKPCNILEVIARLRVMLRCHERIKGPRENIVFHTITLDSAKRVVYLAGHQELVLTNAEFNILELLMQSPEQAFSKEELTEYALGRKYTAYDRSIDVHISNLRNKLGNQAHIKTIRGFGYLLGL